MMQTILTAVIACATAMVFAGPIQSGQAVAISFHDEAARALLERARTAVGAAPGVVTSLQVRGDVLAVSNAAAEPQPFGFTILRPDGFQMNTSPMAHTLSGSVFWQSKATSPAVQSMARTNTERNARLWSLLFLLDTPVSLPVVMKTRPDINVDGLVGPAVEVTGSEGFSLTLVFDRVTHRIAGFERQMPTMSTASLQTAYVRQIARITEYGKFAGREFPVKIEEQSTMERVVRTITRVVVNPASAESLFQR